MCVCEVRSSGDQALCDLDLETLRIEPKDTGTNASFRVFDGDEHEADLKHSLTLGKASCSSVPALLAYPDVAKTLQLDLHVPRAVYVEMDRVKHDPIGQRGLKIAKGKMLRFSYMDILNPNRPSVLYTDATKQTVKLALVQHKHKVTDYKALESTTAVLKSAAYRALLNEKAPTDELRDVMADLSDMCVLDAIMGQGDRWTGGNVGMKDGRLALTDNDCGLAGKSVFALNVVKWSKHMRQSTYDGVMALSEQWADADLRAKFIKEHHFSDTDTNRFSTNLAAVVAAVQDKTYDL